MDKDYLFIEGHKGASLVENATLGVKFSNDIILCKSFLDQLNIAYEDTDLEMTAFDLGYRIYRDKKYLLKEFPE